MTKKICIVKSNYYQKISKMLLIGSTKEIAKAKNCKIVNVVDVPGIFELPIAITKVIKKCDGVIALGCVIKGKTPHLQFISEAVFNSLINLSIKSKKPIGNGIITALNKEQAEERAIPKNKDKGGEAANAIISILRT